MELWLLGTVTERNRRWIEFKLLGTVTESNREGIETNEKVVLKKIFLETFRLVTAD